MSAQLWGRASSVNVQKVMWALAEAGTPHERIDAGGRYGGLDTQSFGAMNPARRVPVWVDGDLVLWESHAILRHLAREDRSGTLLPPGVHPGVADQWLEFASTTVLPAFIGVFFQTFRLRPERRDPAQRDAHLATLGTALGLLDSRLAAEPWLGGPDFSVADIGAGTAMYRYHTLEIDRPDLPALSAWYARLQERPAFRETVMTDYAELADTH